MEKEVVDYLRSSEFDVLWVAEVAELQSQEGDVFHYKKALKLGRYLVTHDSDFWNDQKHPLKESPGLVILDAKDPSIAKYFPVLLRKLIQDYNPTSMALYLDGVKIKLSSEGVVIKMLDRDTQKVATESWVCQSCSDFVLHLKELRSEVTKSYCVTPIRLSPLFTPDIVTFVSQ